MPRCPAHGLDGGVFGSSFFSVAAAKGEKQTTTYTEKKEAPKTPPSKPCAGHLGNLLGAVNKEGRRYSCTRGDLCKFRHVTINNKTDQRLMDLLVSMPPTAQMDLKKAIGARK